MQNATHHRRVEPWQLPLLATPLTAFVLWNYVRDWYGMFDSIYTYRPFVYRAFVLVLADALSWLDVRQDVAHIGIACLSLAGFIAVPQSFSLSFGNDEVKAAILSHLGAVGLMALTYRDRRVYDIMTALLVTLSFTFLARAQYRRLLLLFPVLCANRETAFLVPLVFMVWGRSRIDRKKYLLMLSYMVGIFGTIQAVLRIIYAESSLWTEFFQL